MPKNSWKIFVGVSLFLLLWFVWFLVQCFTNSHTNLHEVVYLDDAGQEITSGSSLACGSAKFMKVDGRLYETNSGKQERYRFLLHDVAGYSIEELLSGQLFICGIDWESPGFSSPDVAKTSLYDVKLSRAVRGPCLNVPRRSPSLLLLRDGRVLIVGGMNPDGVSASDAVEVYDPKLNKITILGRLNEARGGAGCIQISEDRVAVIGGQIEYSASGLLQEVTGAYEVFDLKTGQAKRVGSVVPCTEPILLNDKEGNILVIGGYYLTSIMRDTRWKLWGEVIKPEY